MADKTTDTYREHIRESRSMLTDKQYSSLLMLPKARRKVREEDED